MAIGPKNEGENRKRPRKKADEVGQPVVVSSSPLAPPSSSLSPSPSLFPSFPDPVAPVVTSLPLEPLSDAALPLSPSSSAVPASASDDVWVKLLDQSPWTSKGRSPAAALSSITPRASVIPQKTDDPMKWTESVWKSPSGQLSPGLTPVVPEPSAATQKQPPQEQPEVVQIALEEPVAPETVFTTPVFTAAPEAEPIQVEEAAQPTPVVQLEEPVLDAPAIEPEPVEIVPAPALDGIGLLSARIAELAAHQPQLVALPQPVEPETEVPNADLIAEPEATIPEPEVQPQPEVPAAIALLSARIAALAVQQPEPVPPEPVPPEPVPPEPVREEPVQTTVAETLAQPEPAEPEPVVLPLTPPPITPYFQRFAPAAPPPEIQPAKPAAAHKAAHATQKEIPVEDLFSGVVSMAAGSVVGAFSLGTKAVSSLFKRGTK